MSDLDRVDWPGVYRQLVDDAGPGLSLAAAELADSAGWLTPAHRILTGLIVHGARIETANAVRANAEDGVDDWAVAGWLDDAGRLAHRLTLGAPKVSAGLLHVDPALCPLPTWQLGLALSRAELAGPGAIVGMAGAGYLGLYTASAPVVEDWPGGHQLTADRWVIYLDSRLDEADAADTLAHELSHALDPRLAVRTESEREAYADALAARLAAARPVTVAEARPLVELTDQETPATGRRTTTNDGRPLPIPGDELLGPALPAPGPDSLIAFAGLRLLDPAASQPHPSTRPT